MILIDGDVCIVFIVATSPGPWKCQEEGEAYKK